jgi:hypothetical protein
MATGLHYADRPAAGPTGPDAAVRGRPREERVPLELAVLLASIGTAKTLVREGVELIGSIRDGLAKKNDQVRQDLTTALKGLEERLDGVGKVAEVAESYFRTHENVTGLLSTCQRLQLFVEDNELELGDWKSPGSEASWRLVAGLYQRLNETRDAPKKVLLDRADWYDEQDRAQIAGKLNDFSSAFDRAKGFVDEKKVPGLKNQLEQMITPLLDAELLLEATIFDKILPSLQKLHT